MPFPGGAPEGYAYLKGHSMAGLIDAEQRGTQLALARLGRPTLTLSVSRVDERALGELLFLYEASTAFSGELYDIDAFEQATTEMLFGARLRRSGERVAAHGVMVLCPVHWYQAPASLKLMMDRLVCADGGNPDPTTTHGKDPAAAQKQVAATSTQVSVRVVDNAGCGNLATRALDVRMTLRNLLDQEYLVSSDTRTVLAPGRSGLLTVTVAIPNH